MADLAVKFNAGLVADNMNGRKMPMNDSPSMAALRSLCELRFDLLTNHPELLPSLAPCLIHAEMQVRQIDQVAYKAISGTNQ